jgi:hypothetical protein
MSSAVGSDAMSTFEDYDTAYASDRREASLWPIYQRIRPFGGLITPRDNYARRRIARRGRTP